MHNGLNYHLGFGYVPNMKSFFYIGILFLVFCSVVQGGFHPEPDTDYKEYVYSSEENSSSEEASSESYEDSDTDTEDCDHKDTKKPFWCPRNEIFLLKKPSCPPDTCAALVARYDCSKAPPPKPGCTCKSGYRRLNGKCVPFCDCPQVANTPDCLAQKCNDPNEEFVQEKSTCPGDSCRALVIKVDCSKAPPPKPGCTCKSGYRRLKGKCVPFCDCPEVANTPDCLAQKCNGPNEVFVQEKSTCPGDTCKALVIRVDCTNAPPPQPGCTCKPGYFRKFNSTGPCVPLCDCPEMASSPDCKPTVPPPKLCGRNEKLQCVQPCPPERTCRNRNRVYKCPRIKTRCQDKCVCKPGYIRNAIGECIKEAKCDLCSKPHEFFSCGGACDNECSKLPKQNRTNCPIVNIKCNEKCYCEDGYARDDNGDCIPVNKCKPKPPLVCGPNAEVRCDGCPTRLNCRNQDDDIACIAIPLPCVDACYCKPGFFKNAIGECVTKAQCDQCSKPHEFFSCGTECDNECKNIQTQNRTNCPIINKKCTEKCYCEDGYARDDEGNCIPVDQCKSKPPLICGPNAEVRCDGCPTALNCRNQDDERACIAIPLPCVDACYCKPGFFKNAIGECVTKAQCDQCSKPHEFFSCGTPCDNECKNIQTQNRTNCPILNVKCTEKCYCEDGYARDDEGNCIPVDQCKPALECNGPHEIERCVSCPPARTCRNKDKTFFCGEKNKPCVNQCVCEPGYFRNAIGECITGKQCDLCSKPHEFYSCGGACDNECKNLLQNRTNCPIQNIVCNERCYCEDGYARDKKGNCIPIDKCPPPCKDPNEEFVFAKSCPPDTCLSLVAKFKCDGDEIGKYRCRCKSGYLRPKAGARCVPIRKCPKKANTPDC